MKKIFWLIIFSLIIFTGIAAPLFPHKLTCEYQNNPLGIDTPSPRLSWEFSGTGKNYQQTAFEIIVSEKESDVRSGVGTVWASGKVVSNQNTLITYEGKKLTSFIRYYWRVRVYDQEGKGSAWSEPAWFETAMLKSSDWQAVWIDDGSKQFERDEEFYQDDRMPLFRKQFGVSKKVETARLYISGLGYYEAYLNGKKISDHVIDPGWTTYRKEVLYVVHDITWLIKTGSNVAGVMLGNGWYNPLPLRLFSKFNLRDVQETGRPCLKAEIHIRYADGSIEKIVTDQSWQTAPGPIIRNNVYLGEAYDARLEQPNWMGENAIRGVWKNASATRGPSGNLAVQHQPPIRVTKVVKPISIKEWKPGIFIVDMGQNFAGVARIKVKGKSGTTITLKYGEALHEDGSLNYLTTVAGQIKEIWKVNGGPGAPPTAWQQDRYIMKGAGLEVWSPRFTFHGFRYVEVSGWPGKPDVNAIEGLRMNSDLEPSGKFTCANTLFNQLHSVINWTFLSNVFSVQSDCPGREKMGYGADMVATANAYLYNFNMGNFYRKTVRDYANDQQPDGGITEIAPYTGIADRGYGGHSGPLGWQLAFPYLQKQLYLFYGDAKIISDNYDSFIKQMEFLEAHAIDGLYHWDISDHEALDPRPEAFTASAFYYHHATLATEFAAILGKKQDEEKYRKLADQIKQRIIRKYFVPGTGRFDNGTQSAQLFALWYSLSPEPEKTFDVLMQEFKRHNNHISSGIFGVMMMWDVLRQQEQNELAYSIANQRDYPSLGFMLEKGATTLWETWQYPDNAPSQNHPMFGSIDEWFYRSILGINPAGPAFEKIIIKPQPAGELTWAKGSYHSVKGMIASDWKIEGDKFLLRVSIPANTRAEIWIQSKDGTTITENGSAVQPVRIEKNYAIVHVGSGDYSFESIR
ncbi:MAG: family 78 glycoside hydrolase catalytic domain [Cyclobacteriaceae bacterium]|nr:family 78 glycoside hydrolase catalytic domain [Cyclobacteriaceae bacterium]